MIYKYLLLFLALSCAHTKDEDLAKNKSKQECVKSYLSFSKNKSFFVGLGEGYSIEMAKGAAQADLMKSISVKISSSTTLSETDRDVAISSVTNSETSGEVEGLSFKELCGGDSKTYAVAVLPKSDYFKSVKSKIRDINKEVDSLVFDFDKAQGGEQLRIAAQMRVFDQKTEADYDGLVAICKSFGKCSSREGDGYRNMQRKYKKALSAVSYELQTSGDVGVELESKVKSLLVKAGVNISNKPSPAKADLSCVRKNFSKTDDVNDLVVNINCEVKLHHGSVSIYDIQIESTGLGNTTEKAYRQASNNLEIVSSN